MRRVLVGILWSIVAASAANAGKPEPRVTVRLSQYVGTAPLYVRVTAIVRDEAQELRCPGFRVEFGDGCASAQEPDCDPYGPAEDRPTRWSVAPPKPHAYRQAGEYEVAVEVTGQQDVEDLRGAARLVVIGPEPLVSRR